jgi:hypothetical protein
MNKLTRHASTPAALCTLALLGACGAGTQTAALERTPPRRALDPSACELDRYAPRANGVVGRARKLIR